MASHHAILLIVGFIVVFDALLVFVILPMWIGGLWRPLASRFPPVPPSPGAVRRNFQTFSVDLINLGFCIHVAADETHLHMFPAFVARFFRITPVSIPWDEMRPGSMGRMKVGANSIYMPRWCRDLAAREPAET